MKNNKMFIFSLILIFTGIIGGGLFAIANSIQKLVDNMNHNSSPNITCGVILFILLAFAFVCIVIMFCELFGSKDENDK